PYYIFRFFFFSSRRRHTRFSRDWSSDVCSSDLFLNTLPQFLVLIGCVSLRSLVSRAITSLASSPSPRDRRIVADTTSAPCRGPRSEERRVGKQGRAGRGRV